MRAGYGERLRGVLSSKTRLELVADFGDLPVFDAVVLTSIVMVQNSQPDGGMVQMLPERTLKTQLSVELERGLDGVREGLSGFHTYARDLMAPLQPVELSMQEWTLDDPEVLRLMTKLRKAGKPLGKVVEGKFYRGIVTGFNEAFIINEDKRAELIAADPRSSEIIKPFLRGRDVRRWKAEWAGKYIIAIQNSGDADCKHAWKDERDKKEAYEIFSATYPSIEKHMSQYESKLKPRADQGRFWWELRACAYYKAFESDKIIYPDISKIPRFYFGRAVIYLDCTLFTIPIDGNLYLQSLLSSELLAFFMSAIMPSVMGGSYRFKSIYMEQIPIVIPTPEQAAVLESVTDDSRLVELNALVYEMYGLTPAEVALVERITARAYAAGEADIGALEDEDAEAVEA